MVRKVDKESIARIENFSRQIIKLAAEEKLTVRELCYAADMLKGIAENSTVEWESVEKSEFPSKYIYCEKGLFD